MYFNLQKFQFPKKFAAQQICLYIYSITLSVNEISIAKNQRKDNKKNLNNCFVGY